MRDVSRRAVVAGLLGSPLLARSVFAAPTVGCRMTADRALDQVTRSLLEHMPEFAVYAGVPDAKGGTGAQRSLDDYSPAGEARLRAALREASSLVRAAQAMAENSGCDAGPLRVGAAIVDGALLSADLPYGHIQPLWLSGHVPYVVSQITGPHVDSPNQMTAQQSVRSAAEADAYVAKLRDFRRAFDGAIEKVEADTAAGCIPPADLMIAALAGIDKFVAPKPADHPLVTALMRKMAEAKLDAKARNAHADAAAEAIRERVYPAYARLRETVVKLAARGRQEHGVWALPSGDAFYASNVRHLGDTKLSPAEVHELGLDEVARITAEMDRRLQRHGYRRGPVGDRMNALSGESRFRYPDSDVGRAQLLADLNGMIRRVQALQPRFLNHSTIPPQPVEVRRVPPHTEQSAPGGFYDGPSRDGSRPGIYWINLHDMKAVVRFRLPTLTYHEAVPGHHLQGAVALNQGEAPLLIKLASFNAYQEGWALYAERLAYELGLYAEDPYGDLGRLQDELFRAVRLVADTGLHHERWTRERTLDYMRSATGMADSRVTAEVERYMAWPGQALGYKVGQLRILEMRQQARTTLKHRFDLKGFHDAVLRNGPAPLSIIEDAVQDWIAQRQPATKQQAARHRKRPRPWTRPRSGREEEADRTY